MVMVDVGVCTTDEVAISVLCTVIGHQADQGWVITDGGWMAMSRDLGHDHHGYGMVCDGDGKPLPELGFGKANQDTACCSGAARRALISPSASRSAAACASCRTTLAPPPRSMASTT
jgi:D-serine deaminase-like pyridoxal phosphate-dependent protein